MTYAPSALVPEIVDGEVEADADADEHGTATVSIRVLIDAAADLEVVGEVTNGREVIGLLRSTRADIVLMDIRMPAVDGLVRRTTGR